MFISWLGFLIDPSSTPARVTLGVVTVLVVLQNWMALSASLPRDVSNTWLGRFTLGSFLFNVFAMAELVLVNFGLQAHKWLEAQRAFVASVQRWDLALWKYRSALVDLFHEWDADGDGQITRKEFYRGVTKLIPAAPMNEARDARQRLGIIARLGCTIKSALHNDLCPRFSPLRAHHPCQHLGACRTSRAHPTP